MGGKEGTVIESRGGIRRGRDCGRARVLNFHVAVNTAKVEKENVKEALKV